MTVNSGATFSGRWTNADDYLARRGVYYGSNTGQSWKQRGGMQIYYVANWQPQFVSGGNSSLGVYGWVHRGEQQRRVHGRVLHHRELVPMEPLPG